MKRNVKLYIAAWAVLLVIYNVVVFAVRPILPNYVINYDVRFWIAWGAVIAAFIGQMICAFTAFKAENSSKLFLNIPLITESYGALIAMAVAASAVMLIPDCPAWISVVVCALILGFSIITIIKASATADIVGDVDVKIKSKTLFIKSLTVDVESLLSQITDTEAKAEVKKVFEAVRYSDPMSNEALSGIESQITLKFNELSNSVGSGNAENIKRTAEEMIILIGDRNKKCKLLK